MCALVIRTWCMMSKIKVFRYQRLQTVRTSKQASDWQRWSFWQLRGNCLQYLTLMLTVGPTKSLMQVNVQKVVCPDAIPGLGVQVCSSHLADVCSDIFSYPGSGWNPHLYEDHHHHPPSCLVALTPVSLKCCDPCQGPHWSTSSCLCLTWWRENTSIYARNVVCWLSPNIYSIPSA